MILAIRECQGNPGHQVRPLNSIKIKNKIEIETEMLDEFSTLTPSRPGLAVNPGAPLPPLMPDGPECPCLPCLPRGPSPPCSPL